MATRTSPYVVKITPSLWDTICFPWRLRIAYWWSSGMIPLTESTIKAIGDDYALEVTGWLRDVVCPPYLRRAYWGWLSERGNIGRSSTTKLRKVVRLLRAHIRKGIRRKS